MGEFMRRLRFLFVLVSFIPIFLIAHNIEENAAVTNYAKAYDFVEVQEDFTGNVSEEAEETLQGIY